MANKVYKNEYGSLYAVVEKNGKPRLCCKPIDGTSWTVSGVLAACAGDDATTAEGLQAVLDRAAEVKGWEVVEDTDTSAKLEPATAPPPPAKAEPKAPAVFSYDGLDENTQQALRISEKMILEARQTFVVQVAEAVNIAHDALCRPVVNNVHNGRFESKGEDSFRAWCTYMGFSTRTAYKLLSVHKLLSGASAEEMTHLEAASPSLLYAAAKPSAPPELVQAVKDGDITTHKQYQDAIKRLRDMEAERDELEAQSKAEADALRKQLDEARSAADGARMREEAARKAAHNYHTQLEQEKAKNNTLLDQAAVHIARIQDLEARPVEVAVQQPSTEQIERYREEGRNQAQENDLRELSAMRKKIEDQVVEINQLRQQAAAAPAAYTADDCQRLMDTFCDTLDGYRSMIRTIFDRAQLSPDVFEGITRRARQTLGSLSGYIISLCPENEKEADPFAE